MDEQASAELRKVGKHFNPYTFLASISVPDYRRAILAMAQNETKVDEAFTACALERFRLANGGYPNALNALVPQFATRLPHDIISGAPLKYRLSSDRKFLLYSVGWNETDDGGKIVMQTAGRGIDATQGDWVWSP